MDQTFEAAATRAIAKAPAPSGRGSQPASQQAVSQIIAHLTGCLALVRPAGMTGDEAEDWLAAAAQTLADFPMPAIAAGCGKARRECTHFSQIVPVVAKHCEARATREAQLSEWDEPVPALPAPKLTQAEFDRIVTERGRELSVALDRGMIVRTGPGQFRLA